MSLCGDVIWVVQDTTDQKSDAPYIDNNILTTAAGRTALPVPSLAERGGAYVRDLQ